MFSWDVYANIFPSPGSDDRPKKHSWVPVGKIANHRVHPIWKNTIREGGSLRNQLATSKWIVSTLQEGYKVQSAVTARWNITFSALPRKKDGKEFMEKCKQ